MTVPGERAWRADIDGLRAVSVLVVILFHLGAGLAPGGYVGVDAFFVISGFLITGIISRETEEGRFSFLRFYERRIRRIYPALIVVLAATSVIAVAVQMPRDFLGFSRTLIAAPLFASNFMFLGGDGYFDPLNITKPLLHTWSLGVEEQFYIVFPVVLIACARLPKRRRTAVVAGLVGLSFVSGVVSVFAGFDKAYYLLPMRFWELGVGALLALTRPALSAPMRSLAGGAGLTAILVASLLYDAATPFPGWAAALPVLGAAGVILGEGGPANRLLSTAPMVFLGRISYPMYLWHWPPIVFTLYVTGRPIDPATAVLLFASVVGLSWSTWWLVETPIRSRRVLGRRVRLFGAGAAASLVLVGLGLFGVLRAGWPERLPAEARRFAEIGLEKTLLEEICPHRRRDWSPDLPPCILGDPTQPRFGFAILGDSHGRALAGAIGEAAARLGIKGLWLGRVACTPLLGVDRLGDATRRCAEHMDWAIRRIREVDPKTVIVVGRWGPLVERGARVPEHANPPVYAVDGRIVPPYENERVVAGGLAAALDAVAGRPVALLLGVPEPGFDVPAVSAAAVLFGRRPPLGPTLDEWLAGRRAADAVLGPVLAARPWVEVFDPATVLCAGGRCLDSRDGMPLFVDRDHPSRAGARLIAPILDDFLLHRAK